MPNWDVLHAYEKGYEEGQKDGRRRRVAADIKQQQGFRSLPAGHTALIIDWAAARQVRKLPAYDPSSRRRGRAETTRVTHNRSSATGPVTEKRT